MSPHRLLILKNKLPLGGAETLILQHVRHLDRTRFEVHVLTLRREGRLSAEVAAEADAFEALGNRVPLSPWTLVLLRRYLRRNRIEIAHCHDWISAVALLLASSWMAVKRVLTIHAQVRSWRQWVLPILFRRFDLIGTVSRSQRLTFFEHGAPWHRMVVLPNCYDAERFQLQSQAHGAGAPPYRVVMVGNFYWQKDQATLIRAAGILASEGVDFELHLVGGSDPDREEACKELVRASGLEGGVVFHGQRRVDGAFLRGFDLFVFSSRSEQCPIVLLEAMASGVPVLVSDIPSSMELIGHGAYGHFFETSNPESCAREIRTLLADASQRLSKRDVALRHAARFTPQVVASHLAAAYTGQLQGGAKARGE